MPKHWKKQEQNNPDWFKHKKSQQVFTLLANEF